MKILVINAGSSTIKYQLFDEQTEEVLVKGVAERIGVDGRHVQKLNGKTTKTDISMPTHGEAIKVVLSSLIEDKVVKSLNEIEAVGHRIVHGGENFTKSVIITDEVVKEIEDLTPLAPLHQPAHVLGIRACTEQIPNATEVAVFDTSFHSTMPDYAYRYAIPKEAYKKWGIRKYGFHGSSHRYVSARLAKLTGKENGKFIVCHIGNGASISAIENGECRETSMGYTPLEGLVMGTRSGDIDPSVVERLTKETGMSVGEVINYLNKKCGLLGVSGISEDMRDIENVAFSNEQSERAEDARLSIKMSAYRVKKYIGSYIAVLGGVDAIAFTAGVGENGNEYREECLKGLECFGIILDKNKNGKDFKRGEEQLISSADSKVKVYVIPTNEELVILRDTKKLIGK